MKTATAWAPGNISLIFQVLDDGSKGVGFTVNEGATVHVQLGISQITYNEQVIDLPTVSEVIRNLTSESLSIAITSTLPLGSGFGMSAASALASAYAINNLLHLKKSDAELANIAHWAEVISKTGLGDVANEFFGGFFVKRVSSARFEVERLPIDPIPIYCLSHDKLLTSSILSDTKKIEKINTEAKIALKKIKSNLSFAEITAIANIFTNNAGLMTPEIASKVTEIEKQGGHAAQILLGNAIVSDIPFTGAMQLSMDSRKAMLL